MTQNKTLLREAVIKHLANHALESMEDAGPDDVSVAEIVSAVFTMAVHVATTVMEQGSPEDIDHNRKILDAVVKTLNETVHPRVN